MSNQCFDLLVNNFFEALVFLFLSLTTYMALRCIIRNVGRSRGTSDQFSTELMTMEAVLLGFVLHLLLFGLFAIINVAFCETARLNNKRRINNEDSPDVERNERNPT
ncbi:uncharacterized protein [Choristoneura fumiferana]|uniref:uncharacterized protein n=1 Tax=Choristoneura fumiferana TaxID=7141 RepID=UPI003D1539EE